MEDLTQTLIVMLACYGYIIAMILVSGILPLPKNVSRKFLHAMIGNLPFIMPFFTNPFFPFLVASPFVLVTFLATPYSPIKIADKLGKLGDLTEEGHSLGLVMYAVSYSTLALLYGVKPYVVAAGILPMAYGDSSAALLGYYYGKHKYKFIETKSIEGSIGMFLGSFLSITVSIAYFSMFYNLNFTNSILSTIIISLLVTIVEAISPKGIDNIAVPAVGAISFIFLNGGV
ncbi:phosphatidate cytidylyltransferase [Candidatus Bathyarchaeota archaeon]|nr:phosphatidate cytidylyltransferase [Candidatus Bathyarchaeota archaeon]